MQDALTSPSYVAAMSQHTAVLETKRELPAEVHEHLARRYGADAGEVVALAAADARLARPIAPALPDLLAEAVFAARRRQAGSVADVLLDTTRVGVRAARETCEAAGAA